MEREVAGMPYFMGSTVEIRLIDLAAKRAPGFLDHCGIDQDVVGQEGPRRVPTLAVPHVSDNKNGDRERRRDGHGVPASDVLSEEVAGLAPQFGSRLSEKCPRRIQRGGWGGFLDGFHHLAAIRK